MQSSQPNAMTDRFEIRVKGESSIALPAERALLEFPVRLTGLEKKPVTTAVLRTVQEVESLLRQLSQKSSSKTTTTPPIDYWSRTSLSETKHDPYRQAEQKQPPTEYTSSVDFEARFQKFNAISNFIASLADLPNVATKTVQWILLEETKKGHRSSLRIQAAKMAHQKALDYATALGYSNVNPLVLQEGKVFEASVYRKGGSSSAPVETSYNSKKNMADAEAWEEVGGEPLFQYQPEDIKMGLVVEASFYAGEERKQRMRR